MRIVRSLCIYEWRSWRDFLLPMIFPEATRLRANLGETSSDLLKRLPPHTKTFAFYVNLTDTRRTPLRRSAFSRALGSRGIRILNEHVTDISKHRVQEVCAQAGLHQTIAPQAGNPDEMLIVKSNANYGGEKEDFLNAGQRRTLDLAPRPRRVLGHDGYLIAPRRDVQPHQWRSSQTIVERFIENRHHVFYRAHKVLDAMIVSRMVNPADIKKMWRHIPRVNWNLRLPELTPIKGARPAPAHVIRAVSRFCTAFALDVGSIDVVEDDEGKCYIIDVNASPFWGETEYAYMLRFLAGGLA